MRVGACGGEVLQPKKTPALISVDIYGIDDDGCACDMVDGALPVSGNMSGVRSGGGVLSGGK